MMVSMWWSEQVGNFGLLGFGVMYLVVDDGL
jgi:hypothetical protein